MILSLLLLGPTLPRVQADPAPPDPPHVVFVVGEGEYQSHLTMPALADRLEDAFGWRTTVLLDEELHAGEDNHVPGLEALEGADLCVLYLRFRQWPIEDLAALDRYVGRGGAIAAFRTSTHAFLYDDGDPSDRYNDFGAEVLGAPWIHHYGHESSTDVALAGGAAESPILDGVPAEFHVRSWTYHVQPDFPPADARVLAYGTPVLPDGEEPDEDAVNPVAWTLVNGRGGRVFTTTMGHPEDFHVEAFRRLVGNGMHWALGLDAPEATAADLPRVLHPDDLGGGDAPWERMDYGPFLSTAVSIGEDVPAVPKGIVVEVRTEDGEPTGLRAVYDTDLVAWRCVWAGELELSGIVFDGPHGTFPSVDGERLLRSSAVAGVGEAVDPRPAPYGPIAPGIAQHEGLVLDGDDVWFEASARDGAVRWRERVFAVDSDEGWVFVRDVDVVSDDAVAAPLVFGGFDLDGGAAAAVVHGRGTARGGRALVASSGRVRIAYYGEGASRTLDLADPSDAAPKHRGRWGEPLETAGVLDDAEDDGDVVLARALAAGAPPIEETVASGDLRVLPGGQVAVSRRPAVDLDALLADAPKAARVGHWPVGDAAAAAERNAFSGAGDLRLDGVTWRRGIVGRALDFDATAAAWLECEAPDPTRDAFTVAAWIQTTRDGTVWSDAPVNGEWEPDGVTLFLREGRLTLDVGWVGDLEGGPEITDGAWHHVAMAWRDEGEDVRLFVDGERVARGELPLEGERRRGFAQRFGWTNDDFPETSRFSGYMDGLTVLGLALDDARVAPLAAATGEALVDAFVLRTEGGADAELARDGEGDDARVVVRGRATDADGALRVVQRTGLESSILEWAADSARGAPEAFRVDRIAWPDDNPFDSWMRFGAFDFVPSAAPEGPTSALVATWSGDVWRVDGLDETLSALTWTRFATGLNQPFGVRCRSGADGALEVLVLGRDQITRLVDVDGDGEADRYENALGGLECSEHFHEPASGFGVGPDGSLYVAKAARHAKRALHDHHGTVLRIPPDLGAPEVVARGQRAPFGVLALPSGELVTSDQEGHWMPANRINLVRPSADAPPFLGNGWAATGRPERRRGEDFERPLVPWPADEAVTPPLCWIHPSVDRSPSAQVHLDHRAWGPLEGALGGLSYGTGEVYLVLREDVKLPGGGTFTQGGVVKLGVQLPTGLLAGRVHPVSGDLYVCGLFGWSSDRTQPGGFYRVRPRSETWERELVVPRSMRTGKGFLELEFIGPLDAASVARDGAFDATAWNYRRSSDYGSPTFDLEGREDERTTLRVAGATLAEDGRTVRIEIPDLEPCMQLHVEWTLETSAGAALPGSAHLTVHALGER